MSIYDSEIWLADLDNTIKHFPEFCELFGKSILITGATGLICSAVVDLLIRLNETNDAKIKIIVAGRNKQKAIDRFAPFSDRKYFSFVKYDATSLDNDFDFSCDYVIHGASNASPNHIVAEPVETMLSNFYGVKNLLDYVKQGKAKRLLYISSSEVYGRKEHNRPSKVDDYGGIDILNLRNSYSVSKCAAETLCVSYHEEYGVDSVIVRPGHIYGPTASENDNRVSSAWAYAAARGEDIVLKSEGRQIRSYCYCLDCASAIVKVLLKGQSSHAYNISSPDSIISIKAVAELLSALTGANLKTKLATQKETKGFNLMHNSSLDSAELIKLGWKSMFYKELGFEHTVRILGKIK